MIEDVTGEAWRQLWNNTLQQSEKVLLVLGVVLHLLGTLASERCVEPFCG
jgi:uncharacterized membrane protein YiaA